MSLKTILDKQTDFTGEFPAEYAGGGLWRFYEDGPGYDTFLSDFSGHSTQEYIHYWCGKADPLTNGEFCAFFVREGTNLNSRITN